MVRAACVSGGVILLIVLCLGLLSSGGAFAADEAQPAPIEAGSAQQRSVSLTVYSDGLALVRDQRAVYLGAGLNVLWFSDIAENMDPSSARFGSLTAPSDLRLLEQNFEYDLASREKLLQRYVGKAIDLNCDGAIRPARLLAVDSQGRLIVEMDGRILLDPPGNVELPVAGQGIVVRPTLVLHVEAQSAREHLVELDYLTSGIGWRADYACVLDDRDSVASVQGWATLDNSTGVTYRDAFLKLIAGDVRRTEPDTVLKAAALTADVEGQFGREASFEYHAYTLERRTTIGANQAKQVGLLLAPEVPVKKLYTLEISTPRPDYGMFAGRKQAGHAKVVVEIQNKAASGLGLPLPAGKVRVYRASADGSLDFLGEDTIGHTPQDETVSLYIGDAFDLVGERTVTDYKKTGTSSYEEACCIKLWNRKDEDVEITVIEKFYGEWTISSPVAWQKLDANTAAFRVKVPRGKDCEILYRVRVISD